MTAKSKSARVTHKATGKPSRTAAVNPRPKAQRTSKLEARRLASSKALMKKYAGKLKFAGYDE